MQPANAIRRFLRQLQRVERRRAWGLAALRAGAALSLGVFGALCVAAALEPGARILPLTVFVLAAAVATHQLLVHGVRVHRALGDEAELARWVEARVPTLGSSLVTAVEVGLRSPPPETPPPPATLVEAVLANAAQTVSRLAPAALGSLPVAGAPPEALVARKRRALAPLTALALSVAAILASPGLLETALSRLTFAPPPEERDGAQWVDVAVSQLDLEVAPPAYARLSPRALPRSSGDVAALTGSTVAFAGVSLVPGTREAGLELESAPGERWAVEVMPAEPAARLSGRLTVGADDRYRFALLLEDGTVVRERTWRQVTALPDAAPDVTLVLPEADLEVKPDDSVEFFFEATDDLGLQAVELVARGSDGRELLREAARLAQGSRVEKGHLTLAVKRLALEAGEWVDVSFEARDQRPAAEASEEPAVGRSAARRLTLYSPEAEHDALLALLDGVLEALVGVYADRVEHPLMAEPEAGGPRPWIVAAPHAEAIAKALTGILAQLDEAIARLALDPEATDALRDGVRAVKDRLEPNATHERALLERWRRDERNLDATAASTLMRDLNALGLDDTEAAIFELKRLLDASRKDDVLELGREQLAAQDELMELLKKLKDNPDDATREQVLRKMKQLQAKMQRLRQELARLQERSPYENQNPQQRPSERQTEMADMASAMQQVEDLLKEGRVDEAMKLLEQLNQSTQSMMASLKEDLERGGGRLGAAAAQRQQAFSDELDAVAGQQQGLEGETSASAREAAREAAAKAQQALDGMPLDGASEAVKRQHAAAKAAAEGLREAAGQGGGEAMDEAAGRLSEALDALSERLGEAARGARGAAREGLEAAREQASEAARSAGRAGAPGGSEPLDRLAEAQRRLRERLGKLGSQLSELEKDTPGVEGEVGPRLSEAAERMRDAEAGLGKGDAREAAAQQREALERLKEAQQAMDARQPKPGQDPGGEADGVGSGKDKVAIPKENKPGGARQLRAEILRAMQEETPEAWRDAVKRFYEELTR